jgi:RES domain-containing protein
VREPIIRSIDFGGYRATSPGLHPTDDLQLESYRAGRYHRARSPQPFYAAKTEEGAWAEVDKNATSHVANVRLTLVQVSADVLDAASFEGLAALDLRRRHLVRKDTRLCLELADLAREIGSDGLLVPGAAAAGTNIVIWHDQVASTVEIVSSEIVSRNGARRPVPVA